MGIREICVETRQMGEGKLGVIRRRVRAGECDGAVTRISRRSAVPFLEPLHPSLSATRSLTQPVIQPVCTSSPTQPKGLPVDLSDFYGKAFSSTAVVERRRLTSSTESKHVRHLGAFLPSLCPWAQHTAHSTPGTAQRTQHTGHSTQHTGNDTEHGMQGTALAQEKLCCVGKLREALDKC